MKVAIIFDNFGPYHLARLHAAAQVCEVMAIEIAGHSAEYAWKGRSEDGSQEPEAHQGFKIVTLFQHGTSHDTGQQDLTQRMNAAFDEFAPQAVFVPGWSSRAAFAALNWCARHRVPAVMMSESTEWDEARSAWREAVKRRVVRLCSAALVGGHPHQDYMAKLGMPRKQISLGYDAVDNSYFADNAAESRSREPEVRKKYGLPQNYFLSSARFIEKKNLPRLLEAYAQYRSSAQSGEANKLWDLVLLGDGDLRPSLLNLRSSLNLDDCVHLPGFIQYPDLPTYYGLAGAFIHASTTEQWGLVVNEAMASGLPVLVSNRCGCAQDLVREGINGFMFDPCNVEQIAQLMLKISDASFPLDAFGRASREVITDWGAERFADGLKSAVECAVKVGFQPAGALDRMLLTALARR